LPPYNFSDIITDSGPGTGFASGTVPGQIGICVCPGDGCQTLVLALKLPIEKKKQMKIVEAVKILSLKFIMNAYSTLDAIKFHANYHPLLGKSGLKKNRTKEI
jgi:hypothetical protein